MRNGQLDYRPRSKCFAIKNFRYVYIYSNQYLYVYCRHPKYKNFESNVFQPWIYHKFFLKNTIIDYYTAIDYLNVWLAPCLHQQTKPFANPAMVRTLGSMVTDMAKVLECSQWILERVLLVLQHQARQRRKERASLMANPSEVVRMIAPDVEREFTRLKRN